jgi:hypothetical protein
MACGSIVGAIALVFVRYANTSEAVLPDAGAAAGQPARS